MNANIQDMNANIHDMNANIRVRTEVYAYGWENTVYAHANIRKNSKIRA